MNLPALELVTQRLDELGSANWRRQRKAALGLGNLFQEWTAGARSFAEPRLLDAGNRAVERLHELLADSLAAPSVRVASALALEKVLDACRFPAESERVAQVQRTAAAIIEDRGEPTELRQAVGELASRLIALAEPRDSIDSAAATMAGSASHEDTVAEPHVLRTLERADHELARLQRSLLDVLRQALQACVGFRPETLAEGQQVARQINQLLAAYGFRLVAPPRGEPVTLAFKHVGRSKPGAFVYRSGTTTLYAGVTLPALTVQPVSAPPPHETEPDQEKA